MDETVASFFGGIITGIVTLIFLAGFYFMGIENIEDKIKTGNPIVIKDSIYKCEVKK